MHLTNKEPIRSNALAASGHPDTAGAPATRETARLALEEEFQDWRADNDYLLSNGLPGDVGDLLVRLIAASAKALMSS
jgi:hypothetical protein